MCAVYLFLCYACVVSLCLLTALPVQGVCALILRESRLGRGACVSAVNLCLRLPAVSVPAVGLPPLGAEPCFLAE